jgi:hypothetical protein
VRDRVPAARARQRAHRDDDRAGHQQDRLGRLGIDHRAQPAGERVEAGRPGQHRDHGPERRSWHEHAAHQRAAVKGRRRIDEHIQEDVEHREIESRTAVVATLQKLRHGVDPAAQQEGQQEHAIESEHDGGGPLVIVDRDTHDVSGPGEAHEGRRGDVGGEERQADRRPARGAGSEEIFLDARFAARDGQPEKNDAAGAHRQHHQVEQRRAG